MDIIREDDGQNGAIKALEGEAELGKLSYIWSGSDRIIIDHTEVYPNYAGKGIGQKLVAAAVDFARENQVKILPLCSFAKKVIGRDASSGDVLFTPGGG